jgi:SAM-dependent methyltransferase
MSQPAPAYDRIGVGYRNVRTPDGRIAAHIHAALGDARRVCNVGAGAGSYEPAAALVVAVEPSRMMSSQRANGSHTRVLRGVAEQLPFADRSFDAAMAVLTVHHWRDIEAGLAEMGRVAPRCVVLGFDPKKSREYWLVDYLPMIATLDDERAPTVERMAASLGNARVDPVPVPSDCTDGFLCAYWRRPEAYLDPAVRAGISSLAIFPEDELAPGLARLRADIESGLWRQRHAAQFERDEWDWGYRLIVRDGGGC